MFGTEAKSNAIGLTLFLTAIVAAFVFSSSAAQSMPGQASTSAVFSFADATEVEGGMASLIRTADAVAMELATSGLEPNAPYTIWWVVFNSPAGCSDPCNEDDILADDGTMNLNPDAQISMIFADGAISDATGSASFSALLPSGRTLGQVVAGPGLTNAEGAEVHLVVRYHGPAELARLYDQLSTYDPDPSAGGVCELCSDQQFAVFQAAIN